MAGGNPNIFIFMVLVVLPWSPGVPCPNAFIMEASGAFCALPKDLSIKFPPSSPPNISVPVVLEGGKALFAGAEGAAAE